MHAQAAQMNASARQTVVQKILSSYGELLARPGVRPEKGPAIAPSTQRLEHAQQFGKRVITQASALTSAILLAEGAIASTLRKSRQTNVGDPLRPAGWKSSRSPFQRFV
jgi:hypothetical protein